MDANNSVEDAVPLNPKQQPKSLIAELVRNATYDDMTVEICRRSVRSDSVCIDVGCAAGSVLRWMMQYAPRGKFYAFEPLPEFYQYLCDTFVSNSATKVFPIALSNKKGTSSFNFVITNPAYSGFLRRSYDRLYEQDQEITVATDLLDNLIEEDDRIDFIKVDVEGAELQVFQGAINTIRRDQPTIVFEHGLGAADVYGTQPDDIFHLLCEECGMEISLLDDWLENRKPLSKQRFREQFQQGLNYYFVGHSTRR